MFGVEWLNANFLHKERMNTIALIDQQTGKKRCLPLYAIPDRIDGKSSINTLKGWNDYAKRMNRRYKNEQQNL